MRAFSRLPRPILVLEWIGILLLIMAFLVLNQLFPPPFDLNALTLARGLVFVGVILMLPAVGIIVWRTVSSWLPENHN